MIRTWKIGVAALALTSTACSAGAELGGGGSGANEAAPRVGGQENEASGGGGTGALVPDDTINTQKPFVITGTVQAPMGAVPISGAAIYVLKEKPAPIPDHVYCDTCVQLTADAPQTKSNPNGTFEIRVPEPGDWFLIIQKGAFRRVIAVSLVNGKHELALMPAQTRFPSVANPATGDSVPKIAVAEGNYDAIELAWEKLGVSSVEVVSGPGSDGRLSLLNDPVKMGQYHILMFPCASGWPNDALQKPEVQANLRDYVARGGRVYATDYSYDVVRQVWSEPISWQGDTGFPDSGDGGLYTAEAVLVDEGLGAWMSAQGLSSFELHDNWTIVSGVHKYNAPNEKGETVEMFPHVWLGAQVPADMLEGNSNEARAATVSFQHGCGRVLFSTYHTVEDSNDDISLSPQELALMYTLFEVNVCTDPADGPGGVN